MNTKFRIIIGFIYMVTLIVIMSACTSVDSKKANVNIEVDSSPRIQIFDVAVRATNSHVTVSGSLHKRSHSRTAIPGHIDITFLSPNGEVLRELETDYHRPSINSRESTFSVKVPLLLADGSTVRIEHYRTSKH